MQGASCFFRGQPELADSGSLLMGTEEPHPAAFSKHFQIIYRLKGGGRASALCCHWSARWMKKKHGSDQEVEIKECLRGFLINF